MTGTTKTRAATASRAADQKTRAKARSRALAAEAARLATLPWTLELRRNLDGSYFARVVELPGCMTEGVSEEEVLRNIHEATKLWLATELERGAPIPQAPSARRYSGKFTVRASPLVHRLAAESAARLGISLNEFTSEALALAAGAGGSWRFEVAQPGARSRHRLRGQAR